MEQGRTQLGCYLVSRVECSCECTWHPVHHPSPPPFLTAAATQPPPPPPPPQVRNGPVDLPLYRKPLDPTLRRTKRLSSRSDGLHLTVRGIE